MDDSTRTYIHMPKTNKYNQPTFYRVNDKNKEEINTTKRQDIKLCKKKRLHQVSAETSINGIIFLRGFLLTFFFRKFSSSPSLKINFSILINREIVNMFSKFSIRMFL